MCLIQMLQAVSGKTWHLLLIVPMLLVQQILWSLNVFLNLNSSASVSENIHLPSSVSRKCWSLNWVWYSNPSQKSLIVSMWVLIISQKVSPPLCPISSAVSIGSSSDSSNPSKSFPFGTSASDCISKLSEVVGGIGAEVISEFMVSLDSFKGMRDQCDQIGKVPTTPRGRRFADDNFHYHFHFAHLWIQTGFCCLYLVVL